MEEEKNKTPAEEKKNKTPAEEKKNKTPAEEETETVKTLLQRIADMEEAHKKDMEEKNKQMQAIMQGLKQSGNDDIVVKVQKKVKEFTRW